jgi:ABC-2 type transport system permease protein
LLRYLPRFAARRLLRGLAGWAGGLAAYYPLIGLLAMSLTRFLTDNQRDAQLAAQAGFAELGTVEGYLAALFSLLAIPVGTYAASRVAADAADEVDRRFTMLFALPVSRIHWARVEAAVIALACALLPVVAGLAAWTGTVFVAAPLTVGAALAGVLNVLPPALLCLGAALFALGWVPQAVLPVGVLPAAGGYLVQVLADTFSWPGWVAQLWPFAHVATVPAAPPDWPGAIGILAVAALLALTGAVGYARRDLRG